MSGFSGRLMRVLRRSVGCRIYSRLEIFRVNVCINMCVDVCDNMCVDICVIGYMLLLYSVYNYMYGRVNVCVYMFRNSLIRLLSSINKASSLKIWKLLIY